MHKRIVTGLAVLFIGITLYAINRGISKISLKHSAMKFSENEDTLMNGDLIFQTSVEGQGRAIQLATKSVFTHVGVIFKVNGEWKVYEAVEPVQCVPLSEFTERGDSGKFTVMRLKNRDSLLSDGRLALMKSYLEQQLNKHYDPYFSWDDNSMYCSELVWKSYNKTGLKLSELRKLKSFDLSSGKVKEIIKQRYGKKIPYQENVVSPEDIYQSSLLYKVK